jgi:hypothetical protein
MEPVRLMPTAPSAVSGAGLRALDEPAVTGLTAALPSSLAVSSTAPDQPFLVDAPLTGATSFAQPATASVDLASVDYEPMTHAWGTPRSGAPPHIVTGSTTGGVWLLALSPVWLVGLGAFGWWLTEGATSSATTYVAVGLGVVGLVLTLAGAISDFRRLGDLGHEYRATVAWILAGPFFYLLVRAVHVHRTLSRGTAPTWVYFALAIVVSAGLGALSLFVPREAGATELRAVETQLAADMQAQGLTYTMMCPSEASVSVGSSFVCTAYDEVGPVALVRVTWSAFGDHSYTIE